jgi:hypothetical protein
MIFNALKRLTTNKTLLCIKGCRTSTKKHLKSNGLYKCIMAEAGGLQNKLNECTAPSNDWHFMRFVRLALGIYKVNPNSNAEYSFALLVYYTKS